jgi:hypothetical protein
VAVPYAESDRVLNLAHTCSPGGTRLEDIDRHRNDPPLMNGLGTRLLPDPTTAGDFLRRFTTADTVALLEAINTVRSRLWRWRSPGPVRRDGLPRRGRCDGTHDRTAQGGHRYLLITLANTREVLHVADRPGNAPSHLNAAGWIDQAIDLVAPHAPRVCVRGHRLLNDRPLRPWAAKADFHLRYGP